MPAAAQISKYRRDSLASIRDTAAVLPPSTLDRGLVCKNRCIEQRAISKSSRRYAEAPVPRVESHRSSLRGRGGGNEMRDGTGNEENSKLFPTEWLGAFEMLAT